MGSSLFAKVKKWSRAEGRAEGEVAAARSLCAELVKQHHPAIVSLLAPAIEACTDAGRLQSWALAASRVSDAELERLVGPGRAPRPSRRAKPASHR